MLNFGATATDNEDGSLTSKIKMTGTVNTKKAGTYTITYSVSDKAGNRTEVTRTVVVEKPQEPVEPVEPPDENVVDPEENTTI